MHNFHAYQELASMIFGQDPILSSLIELKHSWVFEIVHLVRTRRGYYFSSEAVRLLDIKIRLTKVDLHPCVKASLHWQWAFFYNTVCERTTSPPTRDRHFCLWAKTLSSLASSNRNMFGYLGLFTRYERDKLLLMLKIDSRSGHWHTFSVSRFQWFLNGLKPKSQVFVWRIYVQCSFHQSLVPLNFSQWRDL